MDNIKKVPEIRFDGFDDEWNVLQLKDLGQKYTSLTGKTKNDFGHGDGRYVTFSNVLANPVSSLNGVEKIEVDNSQNGVKFGDLFFNISSETYDEVGLSSVWTHDVENYYLNSFCMGLRPSVKMDNHFITYLLRSRSVRKQIMKLAQGISRINISQTKMMDILLQIPYVDEQTQIGNFFKNLDEKLEFKKEKHEKLINFKKAMLEDMFPKEGEKVPKVRFEGFDNEWEEKELSEILIKYGSGGTPLKSKKEYYDGDIMFLNISDITESKGIIYKTKKTITEDGLTNSAAWIVPKGSISLAMYASVGKVGILGEDMATSQAFFNMILENRYNLYYVYTFLKRAELKSDWIKIIETGSQPNLNASNVKKFIIKITSPEEQALIGNFFKNLDEKIELSEQKIVKIENFKKAMLDKMFV